MSFVELILVIFVLSLGTAAVNAMWQLHVKKQLGSPTDPRRILEKRFAEGEIDEVEFARRLGVLQMGPPLDMYDLHALPRVERPETSGDA